MITWIIRNKSIVKDSVFSDLMLLPAGHHLSMPELLQTFQTNLFYDLTMRTDREKLITHLVEMNIPKASLPPSFLKGFGLKVEMTFEKCLQILLTLHFLYIHLWPRLRLWNWCLKTSHWCIKFTWMQAMKYLTLKVSQGGPVHLQLDLFLPDMKLLARCPSFFSHWGWQP